jgi:tRNA(fMet)-specific endonuclease VapC
MLFGLHRAQTVAQRATRLTFIDAAVELMPVLSFDLAAAQIHAQVWARLTSAGQMIGTHDLIIAATALAHDFAVLTHNVRDFNRIPGLEVRQPSW